MAHNDHYEPPRKDLRCLQIQLISSLVLKELGKRRLVIRGGYADYNPAKTIKIHTKKTKNNTNAPHFFNFEEYSLELPAASVFMRLEAEATNRTNKHPLSAKMSSENIPKSIYSYPPDQHPPISKKDKSIEDTQVSRTAVDCCTTEKSCSQHQLPFNGSNNIFHQLFMENIIRSMTV